MPAPPGSGDSAPEPASPLAPPPDDRIVGIEEVPESVRAVIANIGISGRIWSEEPALRMLTVQNRIVREGGDAAPGVRVEEITQTGAVLSSGGWRVRITGF